jgi:hypothetical protein
VFVGLALEILAKVGVRKSDKRFGPLGDRLSFQIDHAVLRDYIHHVRAGSGNNVAVRQIEHNAAAAAGMTKILPAIWFSANLGSKIEPSGYVD